jgi:diaminohydroxyphosphoribosylaminopyrimidine deaminase/5-amino-6-(5-phosphoribosylamino)uracil reductase
MAMARTPSECDRIWMRRAIRLARNGEGWTRPNPPVGAVVVKNGEVVGEGWHRKAGGPHAEVEALTRAGDRARGAVLYVTLEPCSTWGRTPPCTEAICRAGLARVVYATEDPNPRHTGRARTILEKAGIRVDVGVGRIEAEALIAPFRTWIQEGRPYVTLKLGLTLDGRIADAAGASRWITSEEARRQVQRMRQRVDAVMVGAGTLRADNPTLLPRAGGAPPVYRVIVAGRRGLPPDATVFTDAHADRTIVAAPGEGRRRADVRWSKGGARLWHFPSVGGRVPLDDVLRRLGREGFLHVLCEGGGRLAGALLRDGLADEVVLFYAPIVLMGGTSGFEGEPRHLANGFRGRILQTRRVGPDWMVRFIPERVRRSCLRG